MGCLLRWAWPHLVLPTDGPVASLLIFGAVLWFLVETSGSEEGGERVQNEVAAPRKLGVLRKRRKEATWRRIRMEAPAVVPPRVALRLVAV